MPVLTVALECVMIVAHIMVDLTAVGIRSLSKKRGGLWE